MKVGDVVRYSNDAKCKGVIVVVGSNMLKVRWDNTGVEEWMPEYALEVIDERR